MTAAISEVRGGFIGVVVALFVGEPAPMKGEGGKIKTSPLSPNWERGWG
jgi:hypothetical protein